ncbi:hypothetical protein ACXJY6_01065 [Vibrio sp. RC27]
MKKLILLICIAMSFNAMAISESATISSDKQQVLDTIIKELGLVGLTKSSKDKLYSTFKHSLNKDWYANWHTNSTLASSKFKDSKTRIFDLNVVDENRLYIITYTYFSEKNQLHITQREIIDGSSRDVIDNYNKYKENEKFEINAEIDSYAFFQKTGYSEYLVSHVKSPNGMSAYIEYKVIDL